MAMTEARKRANAKWDAANMKVISCKARAETVEAFKRLCNENGVTPNSVLTAAMEAYVAEHTTKD